MKNITLLLRKRQSLTSKETSYGSVYGSGYGTITSYVIGDGSGSGDGIYCFLSNASVCINSEYHKKIFTNFEK